MERQTFTLNHDGKNMKEVFGMTTEEMHKAVEENLVSDVSFGFAIYGALETLLDSKGKVFVMEILEKLTGLDLSQPSRITEYLVNSITSEDDRHELLSTFCKSLYYERIVRGSEQYRK